MEAFLCSYGGSMQLQRSSSFKTTNVKMTQTVMRTNLGNKQRQILRLTITCSERYN